VEHMDCCFRAAHARAWLDRRTYGCHRISLGRGTQRTLRRNLVRVRRPKGRRDCYGGQCGCCCDARHIDDSDRIGIAVDPIGTGMVASLARPGGNVTGLSVQTTELPGKRIELLRQLIPKLARLAVIGNANYVGASEEIDEVQTVARNIGVSVDVFRIRRAEDIAPAFKELNTGMEALYVCSDALINANFPQINKLALDARLPTIYGLRDFLGFGGLMSYGAKPSEMFRRAGDYVDKILKGAKPADLPVEQPTKFELVVNLTTAKALGLNIPDPFLLRIDETIE
jgi:putative ABC transport system substrate-binding protein